MVLAKQHQIGGKVGLMLFTRGWRCSPAGSCKESQKRRGVLAYYVTCCGFLMELLNTRHVVASPSLSAGQITALERQISGAFGLSFLVVLLATAGSVLGCRHEDLGFTPGDVLAVVFSLSL